MSTRKRDKSAKAGSIARFEVVLDAATAKALRNLAKDECRSMCQQAAYAIRQHIKGGAK